MMKISGMEAMKNARTIPIEARTLVARRRKLGRAPWRRSRLAVAAMSCPSHPQLGPGDDPPGEGVDDDGQQEEQDAEADQRRAVGARRLPPLEDDDLGDRRAR